MAEYVHSKLEGKFQMGFLENCWYYLILLPFLGRNEILASLCPQVFGMYLVKLAVAMVLAGGIQRTDATGTRVRG